MDDVVEVIEYRLKAKIRYYGSDLNRHPSQLGETPLIEGDLYVMRPGSQFEAQTRKS